MTIMVRKVDANSYVVEMTNELGSITVRVSLPSVYGHQDYSEPERETLACLRAQELALDLVESAEKRNTLS